MWHAAVSDRKRRSPDTGGPISLSYEGQGVFLPASPGKGWEGEGGDVTGELCACPASYIPIASELA